MKYGWGVVMVVALLGLKACSSSGRSQRQQAQQGGWDAQERYNLELTAMEALRQFANGRQQAGQEAQEAARRAADLAREQMIRDTAEAVRRGVWDGNPTVYGR